MRLDENVLTSSVLEVEIPLLGVLRDEISTDCDV